jgi:hypothetical protein
MKTIKYFPLIFVGLLICALTSFSCEKINKDKNFLFEAQVLDRNSDCGVFAIKFTDNLDKVKQIAETEAIQDVYIARNLPEELQTPGLLIVLNIRKPKDVELGVCTDRGPSYPWIYVTNAKLK